MAKKDDDVDGGGGGGGGGMGNGSGLDGAADEFEGGGVSAIKKGALHNTSTRASRTHGEFGAANNICS